MLRSSASDRRVNYRATCSPWIAASSVRSRCACYQTKQPGEHSYKNRIQHDLFGQSCYRGMVRDLPRLLEPITKLKHIVMGAIPGPDEEAFVVGLGRPKQLTRFRHTGQLARYMDEFQRMYGFSRDIPSYLGLSAELPRGIKSWGLGVYDTPRRWTGIIHPEPQGAFCLEGKNHPSTVRIRTPHKSLESGHRKNRGRERGASQRSRKASYNSSLSHTSCFRR
ncbi:hypothetical protein BO82DRAFT_169028 [Aspergillus uvarum CBS 121591]|uniref:Uncharacterized protein n=1 Tax=Aspergillus uvarum CBS 121591 TaxID=1448315 RepID=A0A319C2G0_9EURO|nr:hypothetical protein BO82DRAFT_169028 [Aspergillus uvarum CBS 121591]PYH77979.1 hypothetical protein BO82DRAFT_169028 [Aspergillus uvarum CBS 121591]